MASAARLGAAALAAWAALSPVAGRAGPGPSCDTKAEGRFTVSGVPDAETLRLDDGREVRLTGALPPEPPANLPPGEIWPAEQAAREALRAMTLGKTVELAVVSPARDRYGRTLAQVFVLPGLGEARIWVQGALAEAGHARVHAFSPGTSCLDRALTAEARARAGQRGLWASALYGPLPAQRPREILARAGAYVTVEGTVQGIGKTTDRLYLNFGGNWRWDFTASLERRPLKAIEGAEARLDALAGKAVRVRGWVVRRNGPMIEVGEPALIEEIAGEKNGLPSPLHATSVEAGEKNPGVPAAK